MLELEFINGHNGFDIVLSPDNHVTVSFAAGSPQSFVDLATMAITFEISEGLRATVQSAEGVIHCQFTRDEGSNTSITLTLAGVNLLQQHIDSGRALLGMDVLTWELFGVRQAIASENTLMLQMSSLSAAIVFRAENAIEQVSFSALTAPSRIDVPAGRKAPEWSIGLFDDSAFTRPRATRYGVPVISTMPQVPLNPASSLSQEDAEYLRLGLTPPTRTIYFRCISSQEMPSGASFTPLLNYFPPIGLDLVGQPQSVALTLNSGLSTSQYAVYEGSMTFNVEDTVAWVDGFAYLSVYVPLHMEIALPLRANTGSVDPMITYLANEGFALASTGEPRLKPPCDPGAEDDNVSMVEWSGEANSSKEFAARVLVEGATLIAYNQLNPPDPEEVKEDELGNE